jgi:hypothetical protein
LLHPGKDEDHWLGDENRKYLMHEDLNVINWGTFLFDDWTRGTIDVKRKRLIRKPVG